MSECIHGYPSECAACRILRLEAALRIEKEQRAKLERALAEKEAEVAHFEKLMVAEFEERCAKNRARAWARRYKAYVKHALAEFNEAKDKMAANYEELRAGWIRERDEARREVEKLESAFEARGEDGSAWVGMCDELDELQAERDKLKTELVEEQGHWNEQHAQQHRVNTQLAAERDRLKAELVQVEGQRDGLLKMVEMKHATNNTLRAVADAAYACWKRQTDYQARWALEDVARALEQAGYEFPT